MHTYEVFLKPEGRDGFAHAGSLEAPDDELAMMYARETYIRRGEGSHAWVVRRTALLVLDPGELITTTRRHHATNDGKVLADHRRQLKGARSIDQQGDSHD
jgi:phenylacetate-CoA oxygenase PaaH subunit